VEGLGAKTSHHVLVCNFWVFSCIKNWTFDRNIFHPCWQKTTTKWPKIMYKRYGWKM